MYSDNGKMDHGSVWFIMPKEFKFLCLDLSDHKVVVQNSGISWKKGLWPISFVEASQATLTMLSSSLKHGSTERGVLRCHEHTSMLDQWKLTPKQIKLVEKAEYQRTCRMVKVTWLKEFFSKCPEDASQEEIERCTRAYLLYLLGSTIFSTTTGNKVPVMYLSLFEDFDKAGKFAGGAGALAFLYRELGNSSLESQSTTSGCLTLVQVMFI
ncbi:Protein MAIN-LIKE 2 [Glycine soja]